MEGKKQERLEYLDVAKGIGIVLVCIGHACTNQVVTAECQFADIIRFVTLFHMALFFFINGMLYNEKYSARPVAGIWKKVKSYYIPFVTYNLLFWMFHNLFARWNLISGELDVKDYAYVGIRAWAVSFLKSILGFRQRFSGAMWFLESLIILSVVFILVDFIVTKCFPKKRIFVISLVIIASVLVNRLLCLYEMPYIPDSLTQMVYWGLNGLVFFYLGYLCRIYQWNEHLVKKKNWLVPCLFLLLILTVIGMRPAIVSVITNKSTPIYRYGVGALIGGADVYGLPLLQYVFYSVLCLCGIVMTLLFSQFKIISESRILKLFGRYSLHIMCLQFLAFKAVSFLIVQIYHLPVERLAEYPVVRDVNGFWWVLYAIAGCVLPVLAVRFYESLKTGIVKAYKGRKK